MKENESIHLSVVIPVYGCSTTLTELYLRLVETLNTINSDYEIILVNDASPDNAWTTITEICKKDKRVKGINFSRNFGQHYAITAGLTYASGEWIIVMDCDLQDQPEEITKLYEQINNGFEIILAQRQFRKDALYKKLTSFIFYKVFGYLTDTKLDM